MDTRKRAKANTPEKYLWRKPGARHLWFRYAVPTCYRSVDTRRIVQRCLGTSDRREASLQAARLRCELHQEWKSKLAGAPAPRTHVPTDDELAAGATEVGYERWIPMYDHIAAGNPHASDERFQALLANMRATWGRFYRSRNGDFANWWEDQADALILESGWSVEKGSDRYQQLLGLIAEAALDAFRMELDKAEGNLGAAPQSPVVLTGLQAKATGAQAGESIAELFERYAAQRLAEKRKRSDTVEQDRKVILQFADFVGSGQSIRQITQAEVREWRDTVAALPPKFASAKAYCGLSLSEAAAKARVSNAPKMSPTTINKYLSTVSPFLGWCVRNGYAERNPCDGLFYDLPKGRNPRPPFSPEQLQQIFSSPLFTGFERDGQEHRPGQQTANDWRFWIPVVCLFTGARITEIAQLRIDDLQYEGAVPFISICHDEARQQTTKSGQTRVMPLHPKLVQLGFVAFVERQSECSAVDGNPRLFPDLTPNGRGSLGAAPSRFWRDYLCRIGIKSNADGFGSHSFRHALADKLRLAGYLDEEFKVVLGHSQKSVTSGYGRIWQGTVTRILTMIEQIEFAEVDTLVNNLKNGLTYLLRNI